MRVEKGERFFYGKEEFCIIKRCYVFIILPSHLAQEFFLHVSEKSRDKPGTTFL